MVAISEIEGGQFQLTSTTVVVKERFSAYCICCEIVYMKHCAYHWCFVCKVRYKVLINLVLFHSIICFKVSHC